MIDIGNEDYKSPVALVDDLILSPAQVCAYLRVGVSTLDRMRSRGEGPPFIKIGKRRVGYLWSSIQRWMEAQECKSTEDSNRLVAERKRKAALSRSPGGDDDVNQTNN